MSSLNSYVLRRVTGSGVGPFAMVATSSLIPNAQTDYTSSQQSIGFNFNFAGQTYNSFKADAKGFIVLTGTYPPAGSRGDNANQFITSSDSVIIAPWWDDLKTSDYFSGGVITSLSGSAPNRIRMTQWDVYANVSQSNSNNDRLNFQACLYENGKIEFRYGGTFASGTPDRTNYGATVGVKASTISTVTGNIRDFFSLSGTPDGSEPPISSSLLVTSSIVTPDFPREIPNSKESDQYYLQFYEPINATLEFSFESGSVNEGSSYNLYLNVSTSSVFQSVTAALDIDPYLSDTAVLGTDYTIRYNSVDYTSSAELPIYILWNEGNNESKNIRIDTYDISYPTRSLTLYIDTGSSSGVTMGAISESVLHILDIPPVDAQIEFDTNFGTVGEGTSYSLPINVIIVAQSQSATAAININPYSTDTAILGQNYSIQYDTVKYTSSAELPIYVKWDEGSLDTKYLDIEDTIVTDPTGSVTFYIDTGSSSGISLAEFSESVLHILDIPATGSVGIENQKYYVDKDSTITVGVVRVSGPDYTASVVIDKTDLTSTAKPGIDYIDIFPYTLTWANQDSATKYITIQTLFNWKQQDTSLLLYLTNSNINIIPAKVSTTVNILSGNILPKQSEPYLKYENNYVINQYKNFSYGFTRIVSQVPFSLNHLGTGKIKKP